MTHLFHPDRWLSGWKRTSFKKSCRRRWKAAGEGRLHDHGEGLQLAAFKEIWIAGVALRANEEKIKSSKQRANTHTHTLWSCCWRVCRRAGGADEYSAGEPTLCCQTNRLLAFCHLPSSDRFVFSSHVSQIRCLWSAWTAEFVFFSVDRTEAHVVHRSPGFELEVQTGSKTETCEKPAQWRTCLHLLKYCTN